MRGGVMIVSALAFEFEFALELKFDPALLVIFCDAKALIA